MKTINQEKLLHEYSNKCQQLNKIYVEVNNALYFKDMKKINFYNLIYTIADILDKNDEELGKYYLYEKDVK